LSGSDWARRIPRCLRESRDAVNLLSSENTKGALFSAPPVVLLISLLYKTIISYRIG